jgi:hypothetical protein
MAMNALHVKLQRAATTLRQEGLRSFVLKAESALGYCWMHVLERALDEVPAVSPPAGYKVAALAPARMDAYFALCADADHDTVMRSLAAGCRCFGAWHEGALVSAYWMGTSCWTPRHLGGDPQLAPGEVAFFGALTAPEHRRRSLFAAVTASMLAASQAQGFKTAVVLVAPWNQTALRAQLKVGFRPRCRYRVVGVGPWRLRACLPELANLGETG